MVQLISLNVWLDLSRSLLRFGDKGKNSLQLTQFLILSNWETALLFACECQKSDQLLEGMTGWWKCTVSVLSFKTKPDKSYLKSNSCPISTRSEIHKFLPSPTILMTRSKSLCLEQNITMEREKDKAGLVSETFEASLGKRMVVHLRPPNHLREGSSSLPLTIVRRCTTSSSASKSASTGQAQAQDKHKHSTSTSTSTSNGQAQAKCNSHQKPKCTKSTFSRTF